MLTSCGLPEIIIVGTGATVIGLMFREKGISGTLTDADLTAKVRSNLAKFDFENKDANLSSKVSVSVNNAEVLLIGVVDNLNQKMLAEQAVWEVFGVKQVINQLKTQDKFEQNADESDLMIKSRVAFNLLTNKKVNVRSFNYAIKVFNGEVYLMGIAKDEFERDAALKIVSNTKGVKKVISLVRLRHEILS